MTYDQWIGQEEVYTFEEAIDANADYNEFQEVFDHVMGFDFLYDYPAGWLVETSPGIFYVIAGRGELETNDLDEARKFLWKNHSQYEVA